MKTFPFTLIGLVCATLLSPQPARAQFSQQGPKLAGTGVVGPYGSSQGFSVSLSADGNTAIVGGPYDNGVAGAAWVWTRSGRVWTQQGTKLVGSGAVGNAYQGSSVSVSADGNTAIVGGDYDNSSAGAAWVWTRSAGVWTQQGPKLVGSGAVGNASQGSSVSLSADGNAAIVGGPGDNSGAGAAWVWTRSGGVWTQQGTKLVGSGAVGSYPAAQGYSVSLSGDGNTAIVGGPNDNAGVLSGGAAWIWTRSGGVWTQQGSKLVGSGAEGHTSASQGWSVSLSGDGNTAIVGGPNGEAAWIWTRSGGVWTQQGSKLVGAGVVGFYASQGWSVSLSGDGNTAIVGGIGDNGGVGGVGAAWVWTRSGGVWTQKGTKLVGSGAVRSASQGWSVSLSTDGHTAIVGDLGAEAAWVFSDLDSPPLITVQPANQAVCNANATFTLVASGTPPPALQWQMSTNSGSSWSDLVNNSLYLGATTGTLTLNITGVTIALNGYQYRCVATNSSGSTNSTTAVLTVNAAFPELVVAWGNNSSGQTTVPDCLSGVTAIAAGGYIVALKSDGTVVAFFGQATVPSGLSGVTAIAASGHTVALKSDGTVVAWGNNGLGQTTVPAGLSGVTAIAAGGQHTVALKSDGTMVAWGNNSDGEATIPAGLSNVTAIAAGDAHTVALKSDGTVVAWGFNSYGATNVPAGLSGVTAIAAGGYFTVALKSNGTVVAWGDNGYNLGATNVPVGLSGVTAIAAGFHHTVALKSDGTVVAWGYNNSGQTNVPAGLNGVTAIAAGGSFTVALVGTAPPIAPTISGKDFILSWPTNATGYVLQTTTNLTAANSWLAVTNMPTTVNQQSVVTNQISGAARFYRLRK